MNRDDAAVAQLYEGLVRIAPTIGALVARAAAVARVAGAARGLELLDAVAESCVTYQPYWATRAHLLTELARPDEARVAFDRALGPDDRSRRASHARRASGAGVTRAGVLLDRKALFVLERVQERSDARERVSRPRAVLHRRSVAPTR